MEYYTFYDSPLGPLLLTADPIGITGIWYDNAHKLSKNAMESDSFSHFILLRSWLDAYFSGKAPDIRILALHPSGTPFQMLIWELLQEIPYGKSATYGDLAKAAANRLGKMVMSAQAVGGAVGKNPLSIVIPCHRVLGRGSSLTGYAGGLDRKNFLLDLEKIHYV